MVMQCLIFTPNNSRMNTIFLHPDILLGTLIKNFNSQKSMQGSEFEMVRENFIV